MNHQVPTIAAVRDCLLHERGGIDWGALELKRQRWVKNTLRQVYIAGQRRVIKCFFHYPGRRDRRRPWVQEDRALRALSGLNVPESHGYFKTRLDTGIPAVVYVKAHIKGEFLEKVSPETATAMGKLLAQFHDRGVVTLDPSLSNFIRSHDGILGFIDFGRARVYPRKGVIFQVMVGKEFFRIFRESFFQDPELLNRFKISYYSHRSTVRNNEKLIAEKSFGYWKKRHQKKKRKRT